jgi:hypothetical protein
MNVSIIVRITSSNTAHTENCTCVEELQARHNVYIEWADINAGVLNKLYINCCTHTASKPAAPFTS